MKIESDKVFTNGFYHCLHLKRRKPFVFKTNDRNDF